MKKLVLIALLSLLATLRLHASVAAGRAALEARNLALANTEFQQAVAANSADAEANLFYAVTRLAVLQSRPDVQALLTKMGVPMKGRNPFNWRADLPKRFPIKSKLRSNDFESLAASVVLPELIAADQNLAAITAPNFSITLTTQETGALALTIDRGDVLFSRALIQAAVCAIELARTYETDAKLGEIGIWLKSNAMTMEGLLAKHPAFFNVADASRVNPAINAYVLSINNYSSAADYILARPPEITDRLFMIDPELAAEEAKMRAHLVAVRDSFTAPATFDNRTQVNGAAFTASPLSIRSFLPQFANNKAFPGSFPDPTFGGILPGMTEQRVEEFFGKFSKEIDYLFNHRDDPKLPVLVVTSPKPGSRVEQRTTTYLENYSVTFSGLAKDNVGVTRVELFPKSGPKRGKRIIATGTTSWTAEVPVFPGKNQVIVRAFDAEGNASIDRVVNFQFVRLVPIDISASDGGSVSPVGSTFYKLAGLIKLLAKPAKGFVFSHWEGETNYGLGNRFYRGVEEWFRSIRAVFIPSPFISRKGTYNATLRYVILDEYFDAVGFKYGFASVTVTETGAATGCFIINGAKSRFRAHFDTSAFAEIISNSGEIVGQMFLQIEDVPDATRPSSPLSITVYQTVVENGVLSSEQYDGFSYAPDSEQLPNFTVGITPPNRTNIPRGVGYAGLTRSASAVYRGLGKLPDGTPFTFSAPIDRAEKLSFHSTLDVRGSTLAGEISVDREITSDGDVRWSRAASIGKPAFAAVVTCTTSTYTPPARREVVEPFASSANAGSLLFSSTVVNKFTVNTANKVTFTQSPERKDKLKFDTKSGLFEGSFFDPLTGKTSKYSGVLQQEFGDGVGFGLRDGTSFPIRITSP